MIEPAKASYRARLSLELGISAWACLCAPMLGLPDAVSVIAVPTAIAAVVLGHCAGKRSVESAVGLALGYGLLAFCVLMVGFIWWQARFYLDVIDEHLTP